MPEQSTCSKIATRAAGYFAGPVTKYSAGFFGVAGGFATLGTGVYINQGLESTETDLFFFALGAAVGGAAGAILAVPFQCMYQAISECCCRSEEANDDDDAAYNRMAMTL